jgi:nitroreductase
MNEVIKCILERRAIRRYKPEQISKEELDLILQAGMYAPSASGRQDVIMVVSQSQKINETLGKINKSCFQSRMLPGTFPVSKEQPSIADDTTIASAFYGAPTVITLFGGKGSSHGISNCSVSVENMMLAAHSLGIGSCMIARARETFESDYGKQLLEKWQIDEQYEPIFHVTLGYRDGEPPKAKPRKENRIKYVE